jgi:hypothetical protein
MVAAICVLVFALLGQAFLAAVSGAVEFAVVLRQLIVSAERPQTHETEAPTSALATRSSDQS